MKTIILLLASVAVVLGQPAQNVNVQPDCQIPFIFTVAGSTAPVNANGAFNNKQVGCNVWQVQYASTGFSVVSLVLQSANDSSGIPGAFSTISGTVTQGTNPQTSTTGASNLITTFGTAFAPWVRVTDTTATGVGQITGIVLGWRQLATAGTSVTGTVTVTNLPATVDTNEGNPTASTIRDIPASMGTILSGQQAVTGTATALATNTINNLCVNALSTNTTSVFIGPSGVTIATGFELKAGAGWCSSISNSNLVFVVASGVGPTVTWIATK